MGGLVIDVVIAYIIRLIVRVFRLWRGSRWQLANARINSSSVGGGWVWNCPTTEIAYTYDFGGQTYSGIDTTPFMSKSSAEDKAELFKGGETAKVRVNPSEPERSVLIS